MLNRVSRFLIAGTICLASVASSGRSEPARVVSWNLENHTLASRWVEGHFLPGYPKPENEKRAVIQALLQLRPDILLLQEVGGAPFLRELRDDLGRAGLFFPTATYLAGPDENRRIAVMTVLPVVRWLRHGAVTMGIGEAVVRRGLLGMETVIDGVPTRVYTLHLKSRRQVDQADPAANTHRLAEAESLARWIKADAERYGPTEIVLMGDFNDLPDSPVLDRLMNLGEEQNSLRRVPLVDNDGADWTHFFRRRKSHTAIDHLLLTGGLEAVSGGISAPPAEFGRSSDHRALWVVLGQASTRMYSPVDGSSRKNTLGFCEPSR